MAIYSYVKIILQKKIGEMSDLNIMWHPPVLLEAL